MTFLFYEDFKLNHSMSLEGKKAQKFTGLFDATFELGSHRGFPTKENYYMSLQYISAFITILFTSFITLTILHNSAKI